CCSCARRCSGISRSASRTDESFSLQGTLLHYAMTTTVIPGERSATRNPDNEGGIRSRTATPVRRALPSPHLSNPTREPSSWLAALVPETTKPACELHPKSWTKEVRPLGCFSWRDMTKHSSLKLRGNIYRPT